MKQSFLERRCFMAMLGSLGGLALAGPMFGWKFEPSSLLAPPVFGEADAGGLELARYPQKTDLILLTDRPPQLETPLRYFRIDLTPNQAFFVRWHLSGIPTTVDVETFRLAVSGHVQKPLTLSLHDLQTKFEPISYVALNQCSGNSRSLFEPRVPGGQWGSGAMGNARWKGAKLKDVLDAAGVLPGAVQVGFSALDVPATPTIPAFEKSLPIDHAREGEVMIAYEMNDAPLPILNGFPIRLVVPGWYGTYWVKSLSLITVLDQPLKTFWMDKAYRIPNNPEANEDPQHLAAVTVPINRMAVHSIFVRPEANERLRLGQKYKLEGVASDGGSGIRQVEVSTDGGETWTEASLGPDLGRYSWRRWWADWKPTSKGSHRLMVRAINGNGEAQHTSQWNRSGYQRNVIEQLDITVL